MTTLKDDVLLLYKFTGLENYSGPTTPAIELGQYAYEEYQKNPSEVNFIIFYEAAKFAEVDILIQERKQKEP